MTVDVEIPEIGESITEGTVLSWLVKVGDEVAEDQPLLELETDKITAELPAPVAGVIVELLCAEGEDVLVGAVVARIEAGVKGQAAAETERPSPAPRILSPAVLRVIAEAELPPDEVESIRGTGKSGLLLKGDVLRYMDARKTVAVPGLTDDSATELGRSTLAGIAPVRVMAAPVQPKASAPPAAPVRRPSAPIPADSTGRAQRRVPMTRLRRRIAERLKEVQNSAAILTTFNEVDMQPVMELRGRYKEAFLAKHETKLGFMGFFTKAAVEALKEFPAVNGYVDGEDIVYNEFYDIGVAVSSKRGLVVPVLRDADQLSFAGVERGIKELAAAARDGKLTMAQLSGGTFSITNGGVFGSMLSTPILNAPQSAILGMHNIIRRAVVVGEQIVIRPVMYLALSYDHRIVDGSEAVRFLVKIKEIIEDPARLLLEV